MAAAGDAPRKNPTVKWKPTGRTGVLLNLQTGDYFELDEVGVSIWKLLDGKTSQDELVRKLARSYRAEASTVKKDVTRFLSELKKKKLIEGGRGR